MPGGVPGQPDEPERDDELRNLLHLFDLSVIVCVELCCASIV